MRDNSLPTVFVILGATGDLMHKKLAPGLFHLFKQGKLPKLFGVVGFSKENLDTQSFQKLVEKMIREQSAFTRFFAYQQGLFEKKEGYKKLATFLGYKDKEWQVCSNKLFYIASSPHRYPTILRNLAASGLTRPCSPEEGWTRIVVEKPFGKDLQTAKELDLLLGKLFREEQIYRVDHYLAKETVQNILAFRFSNSFLQDSWNKRGIESIAIRLFEKEGIGNRGAFYDGVGALRDVGQNHVLQLLALFCMATPATFDGDSLRAERTKVFEALPLMAKRDVKKLTMRGQYKGYTNEKDVESNSQTETYFRLQVFLNNNTWKGVPIVLESGKGMKEDLVEVELLFRHPTPCLCLPAQNKHYHNILRYYVQPQEGIEMSLWVKKPGPTMIIDQRAFSFDYKQAFRGEEFADAYERLLLNIIQGDQTLFVSTQEIMASWKFVDSVLRGWEKEKTPLVVYPKGVSQVST